MLPFSHSFWDAIDIPERSRIPHPMEVTGMTVENHVLTVCNRKALDTPLLAVHPYVRRPEKG